MAQATFSWSSVHAEAKAITKGYEEGIHAKNLLDDLTSETHNSELWINGSSSRAISQRVGLGR